MTDFNTINMKTFANLFNEVLCAVTGPMAVMFGTCESVKQFFTQLQKARQKS